MRGTIALILLALAPLGWGEVVYYCSAKNQTSVFSPAGPLPGGSAIRERQFKVKVDTEAEAMVLAGDLDWYESEENILPCLGETCSQKYVDLDIDMMPLWQVGSVGHPKGLRIMAIVSETFTHTEAGYAANGVTTTTGTCTKF